jgi:hypothetical protein
MTNDTSAIRREFGTALLVLHAGMTDSSVSPVSDIIATPGGVMM